MSGINWKVTIWYDMSVAEAEVMNKMSSYFTETRSH